MTVLRWIPASLFCVLAEVALASEEAGHGGGHGEHHAAGIPWLTLGFTAFNFILFSLLIAKYVAPSVRSWLRERHERVVRDLEAAATAKAEALKLRDEWQARIGQLGSTIESMRAQARADADRERERILAAAQKAADAILRDAERTAAYQLRRTEEELRAELAKAALKQAEAQVRAKWTSEDQMRFVADFLSQVQA